VAEGEDTEIDKTRPTSSKHEGGDADRSKEKHGGKDASARRKSRAKFDQDEKEDEDSKSDDRRRANLSSRGSESLWGDTAEGGSVSPRGDRTAAARGDDDDAAMADPPQQHGAVEVAENEQLRRELGVELVASSSSGDGHMDASMRQLMQLLERHGHAYDTMVRNGVGAHVVKAHQVFHGDMRDGKPNGRGSMTYPDGSLYMCVPYCCVPRCDPATSPPPSLIARCQRAVQWRVAGRLPTRPGHPTDGWRHRVQRCVCAAPDALCGCALVCVGLKFSGHERLHRRWR
jgi:hypothetical protein